MEKMKVKSLTIFLFAIIVLNGCASTYFKARFEEYGEYGAVNESLSVNHPDTTPKLFIETAPEGITLKEGMLYYDKNTYALLGRIDVFRNFDNWALGFSEYNEEWRQRYCPPLIILTYASLFTLLYTGLPCPCIYETSKSFERIEERKAHMVKVLLNKGKEIGATHIVFAKYSSKTTFQTNAVVVPVGKYMAFASGKTNENDFPYAGIVGYALQKK